MTKFQLEQLCAKDRVRIMRPFAITVDRRKYACAASGYALLLGRDFETDPLEDSPVKEIRRILREAPKRGRSVKFAALQCWMREKVKPIDGVRPGWFLSEVIDRNLVLRYLRYVKAETVTVRARKGELEPVYIDCPEWIAVIMPMARVKAVGRRFPSTRASGAR